jgi:succinyl-diaminopimelate desuccinylase
MLDTAIPTSIVPSLGLPPKLTVTSIRSGTPGAYSLVPDRCEREVDVRLTPDFSVDDAWQLLTETAKDSNARDPAPRRSRVERASEPWPPFQLPPGHRLPAALRTGVRVVGFDPLLVVAGPSNIGNLLDSRSIPATAGFGLTYRNLHASDESVELDSVAGVYRVYREAVPRILDREAGNT